MTILQEDKPEDCCYVAPPKGRVWEMSSMPKIEPQKTKEQELIDKIYSLVIDATDRNRSTADAMRESLGAAEDIVDLIKEYKGLK